MFLERESRERGEEGRKSQIKIVVREYHLGEFRAFSCFPIQIRQALYINKNKVECN